MSRGLAASWWPLHQMRTRESAVLFVDGREHPVTGQAADGFWLGWIPVTAESAWASRSPVEITQRAPQGAGRLRPRGPGQPALTLNTRS